MTGNIAANGGAIANTAAGTHPALINCIIYDNPTTNGEPISNTNSATSTLSYTLLEQATCPTGSTCGAGMLLGQNPQFIGESNLHIQTCSPVIDAGLDSANPTLVDADGNSRKVDAIAGGSIIDLGAYERQAALTADRLYVNANLSESKEGTSWADAFNNLQEAMTYSCPGVTEIWVAAGIYKPTNDTNRNISFVMKDSVAILGGFPDTGDPGIGDRDWVANLTILSGDLLGNDGQQPIVTNANTNTNTGDNSYTVVNGSGNTPGTTLDGFVLTAGNADGIDPFPSPTGRGAGVMIDGGILNLMNCTFSGNAAPGRGGGGLYVTNGATLPMINCNFTGNAGTNGGAAFFSISANSTLTNCSFSNNSASFFGGAIAGLQVNLSLMDCGFTGNTSSNGGGGIFQEISNSSFANCTFTGNSSDIGGGISAFGSTSTISNCTFDNNVAGNLGGGIVSQDSSFATIDNCTFSSNRAFLGGGLFHGLLSTTQVTNCFFNGNSINGQGSGAAICNNDTSQANSQVNITNTVFFENAIADPNGYGAAIFNNFVSPTIVNCTFSGNSAGFGSTMTSNDVNDRPVMQNCIIYGDITSNGESILNQNGSITSLSHSIIDQDTCPAGTTCDSTVLFNQDPLFVNTDSFDLRLLPCSPAIDAGNNAANISLLDINGNPRIFNATGISMSTIDIGAYEMPTDNTLPTNWTGLGDGVLWSDALNWGDGFIPQTCRDIIIPSGTVTVPAGYQAQGKSLDVLLGAELVTEPTAVMDIEN